MMCPPFRCRRSLFSLLTLMLVHGVTVAQDAALPMIPVTAPALPETGSLNTHVVEPTAIQAMRAATSDTARLLRDVPGLNLYTAGGVSSLPVIHGLADDRLRIKIDGMDLISACGNHMNPPLSYIDPSHVGSIEVMAGISPVSQGGDSIGGAIVVESAAPQFAEPGQALLHTAEVGAFYRSNGNAYGGSLSATLASENVSLSYRGATAQADNYKAGDDFKPAGPAADGRRWLDADEVGSTYYKSTNQQVALAVRNDNHLTEIKLGQQSIPYQGWPNQRMDMTGNDSTQTNLRYQGEYGWGDLEVRAYHEHTRHYMQFGDDKLYWYGANDGSIPDGEPCEPAPGPNGCAAGMPMDTEGNNNGLSLKADIALSARDLVRLGTEAQRYRLDDWWDPSGKGMWPNTFWNIRDGERDRLALFSEWEAEWNQRWLTQFGVRVEQVTMNTGEVQGYSPTFSEFDAADFNAADRKKTDNNLDLTALGRYTPGASRSIEFGLAQKTRSPNLYERYAWSTNGMAMRMVNMVGDGNGYVGNLVLEPEIARTVSATFAWHDAGHDVIMKRWELKLTPYYTHVDDYIDAERCSSASTSQVAGTSCIDTNLDVTEDFVYLQFVNQTARIYGLDVSGHLPVAENTAYGDFIFTGLLSYTRGKNATTGDNLYNIMPLNARLSLAQRKGSWTNTAELELVDAKTKVSATRNEMQTAGYGLLHLRSSYEWRQVRVDVGIENVLDRFYNHPLGGAYLGQGKTMSADGVPWGVPVPGMGRSFYAGINVKI